MKPPNSTRALQRDDTIVGCDMRRIWLLALAGALAVTLSSWGKKKKEEQTQVLQLPKDPPGALRVETRRLVFHVTPLSPKALLSQQTRDALKWLLHSTNGAAVVKLRAFVAGRDRKSTRLNSSHLRISYAV